MIGQCVANLIIPGDPQTLTINCPATTWTLDRHTDFAKSKAAIQASQCAETYFLESQISLSGGSTAFDAAFEELTPIFLAASYATGFTVTSRRSTPMSEAKVLQASEHWPRARAMDRTSLIVTNDTEFVDLIERFVHSWRQAGRTEKALLLVHHWLDAIVCWSMEDLYLSATTLLQVIVATEAAKQNQNDLPFYAGVTAAAQRFGLRVLSDDFKNMRNELIHDGQLIGRRFPAADKHACGAVVVDVLNWLDEYIHAALSLGNVRKIRFSNADMVNLNAYSV